MVNLVLLGAPGAGKGTQAMKISQLYNISHISTGDILRDNIERGTQLGLEAKKFMDRGKLVPDSVLIGIIEDRLSEHDTNKGFLLDGYPRTIPQAQALEDIIDHIGKELDAVIDIEVPDEVLVKRLAGRRMCRCGVSYHVKFNPPEVNGKCDHCGGELYQRDDDAENAVKTRLVSYYGLTYPLIDYYSKKGLLKSVNGTGNVDDIFKEINSVIELIL
ncbi:MAG: adenylate kinase [Candidatus Methanocomedens sp.]|nr:MAG: adenylate kinase [ANME-2 cluster archaeon]